jgi:archaellum biogenesis ATPase FlaH|tara:strand:+ start:7428 stop:9395 length:1968 start_codon:yes stop_codon:yes gene_type:complete
MEENTPNHEAIKADLEWMTARWHEIAEPVEFEIRAFKENCQNQTARFRPGDIDEAVHWATDLNLRSYNVYVVRNPIRAAGGGSAKDADIVAAFYLWADCDDEGSADNVRRFDGPKYNAAVITGRVPSIRVHTYWEITSPCTDMAEWRSLQVAIARHFNSDDKVINPSRIMRLGGTVAWPDSRKQARGYAPHLTELKLPPAGQSRPAVSLDQMRRVFDAAAPQAPLSIDVGPQPMDRERVRIQALSGQEWHHSVVRLVASYVGKGLSDNEIHGLTDPLTLPGFTIEQTRREVQTAIDGARAKGWTPESEAPVVQATPQTIQDFTIDDSAAFLSDLQPLEYLIDGLLPVGVAYSLTGHAGHGKTTLALQFAISVARGEMFADRETSKGKVLILAGENPYNVKWQYAAALAARNLSPKDVDIHFVQGRFSIKEWSEVLRSKMEAMPDLKMVIVDSLQAFFEGDNDNDNTQMVEMAHRLRNLCKTHQRPALLIIAHPAGKVPQKDNLVPRGGGAFLNEIDGNLTVWSQDASQQTLHHSQKFRGAGFDPMEWVMQIHEFSHLTDIHGTPLKLPVSRPETTSERVDRENTSDDLLRRYLDTVERGQPLSVREAAGQFGVSRWRMQQVITTARDEKLIKRYAKTFVITEGGKDFLEGKHAGL